MGSNYWGYMDLSAPSSLPTQLNLKPSSAALTYHQQMAARNQQSLADMITSQLSVSPKAKTSNLINDLIAATGPTSTAKSTVTEAQNRSPELEARIGSYEGMLNSLLGQYNTAYGGKYQSYNDLIKSLSDVYNAAGSSASKAAGAGALSSGLTPLEATGASTDALLQSLQQYFPALAGLQSEQASVPVDLANATTQMRGTLELPFLQSILSPYLQGIAGTTKTGAEETTDTLGRQKLLADLLSSQQGMDLQASTAQDSKALEWAKLNAQIAQMNADQQYRAGDLGLRGAALSQDQQQFLAKLAADERLAGTGFAQDLEKMLLGNKLTAGREEAGRTFEASQTGTANQQRLLELLLGQKFTAGQNELTRTAEADRLQKEYGMENAQKMLEYALGLGTSATAFNREKELRSMEYDAKLNQALSAIQEKAALSTDLKSRLLQSLITGSKGGYMTTENIPWYTHLLSRETPELASDRLLNDLNSILGQLAKGARQSGSTTGTNVNWADRYNR